MKRFAFYAVNGLGVGHVTRLLSIARALRAQSPGCEVLFLTSSEASHVITREGFAAVKVPSKTMREQVQLSRTRYLRLVQSVTWAALSAFDADVLVVDTYPAGSFEELIPVLRWRQKNAFVFREQRAEAASAPLMQATLPLYDLVLVPHADARAVGDVPEPSKLRAVGPILLREREELPSRAVARQRLGIPEGATALYLSFGGGGDPDLARSLEQATAALETIPNLTLRVGSGPLGRASVRHPLGDVYPALDVLKAFDVGVCGAGYNSVHESLWAGLPTVFVPFSRVLDDQETRAAAVERAGAGRCVRSLDESVLVPAVKSLLLPGVGDAARAQMQKLVPTNGAGAAAKALVELAGP